MSMLPTIRHKEPMMTNVVKLHNSSHDGPRAPAKKPRTFTTNEEFIEELRDIVRTAKDPGTGRPVTYKEIALDCSISPTTVQRLASGTTVWPRHTTLFAILKAMRKRLAIVDA